jgi:formate-dependent nitrite reductase cytochrome c552 subunit
MADRRAEICHRGSPRSISMHKKGPNMRTQEIKIVGIRPATLIPLLLLLVVVFFSARALAAPASGAHPISAKSSQAAAAPGDYVGQETCATCHEEVAKGFSSNPHSKLAEMHGKTGVTCEGCHGPGKAHVDGGGDITKIFNPAKATAKEVDAKCLSCHQGQHANFERTAHGQNNVSCVSCHSVLHG